MLPSSLNYIASEAFANCNKLLDVYCHAENVPLTHDKFLYGSYPEHITLHVPANALNDYKNTAHWSSFGNIVALTDEEMSIEQLTSKKSQLTIYDLSGRRTEKAEKGIYIVNGCKIVIK